MRGVSGQSQRVALVTRAASDIGAAVAARLAERGYAVAGIDLAPSPIGFSLEVDPADLDGMQTAAETVAAELGPVSVLVTSPADYEAVPTGEIDDERWRRMLTIHLGGVTNACWAVLPGMLAARSGTIVAITSELALAGGDGDAHYAAANGAILGLIRSLGCELAPLNIRANSVAPGPTDIETLDGRPTWADPTYLANVPIGRLVTPAEIAETVLFLVEEGSYFAGQTLSPNAGAVI
jgi:NAD(P)-dependent dehydrogenase (short-subunit alcohol dehydrogenase family)